MVAPEGDAAFCGIARSSPLMQEYGRTLTGYRVWVIPVGYKYQIVQRIGTTQFFVAVAVRRMNQMIIGGVFYVV
ncbi:hypothetical protein CLV75_3531 [Ruegeria conchae]|uniref:Uncharacterized protein n=1 Tax=Ruegeria conchae TaxID=981384 RepID=A0A497YWW0_9RHOB|nr:hypothetical protein CLV75_3531 [Ruegeria conchae]